MQRRKINSREYRKVYAIVGDGSTEKIYFDRLKESKRFPSNSRINIKPELPDKQGKGGGYVRVFNRAQSLSKEHEHVFCLIDMDVVISEGKIEAYRNEKKQIEKRGNITVIENNPCFEIWFLLHFKSTTTSFQKCDDVIQAIQKQPDLGKYSKSEKALPSFYNRLEPHLCKACANSRTIENDKNRESAGPDFPRCQMYLVLELLGLCSTDCQT
jgi:hypothetical protein